MVRFGLLGCGRIGQVHARSIDRLPDAQLVAVSDAVPAAAETLAGTYGADARPTEAVIGSADIDAVIIGTPTTTHFDLIHAAAAAGKAIFCEKPVDLASDRAAACKRAVEAAGVPFLCAFQRRFDPHFASLERQLRGGAIGRPELVILTSRDPSPPPISYIKQSGGLFRDMMIHDLDMARFLLPEEPQEVFATGSCLVDPAIAAAGDIDTAAVTLRTASGQICMINNSRRASYGYDQRIEVHGETGMLRADNMRADLVEHAGDTGFRGAPTMHFFLERYEAAYLAEMAHFVGALQQGTAMASTIDDGLKAQRLADAAAQSMETGQPVRLRH
ncbi:MAG: inositol 2-dehydrogenase [Pseudomonadota bacterium]